MIIECFFIPEIPIAISIRMRGVQMESPAPFNFGTLNSFKIPCKIPLPSNTKGCVAQHSKFSHLLSVPQPLDQRATARSRR